jgi:tight adherence protein C
MSIMLLPFVTFAILTTVVLCFGRAFTAESAVTVRVRQLVDGGEGVALAAAARTKRSGLLRQLVVAIGSHAGGNDRSLTHRLSVAGFRGPRAAAMFLGTRTLMSVAPALLAMVPAVSSGKPLGRALMMAALWWAMGHLLANLWLKRRGRQRTLQLTKALPDALDLMVVCLEAGLGLNATIQKVGDERATVADVLGSEFAQVSDELRNGRTRADALRGLGTRNGCDDLKALVGLVIQSDRLGASMAKTLRTHADLLRTKRRQRAEETARKLPIKILMPLAVFILPTLFVVTTGPAILQLGTLTSTMAKR